MSTHKPWKGTVGVVWREVWKWETRLSSKGVAYMRPVWYAAKIEERKPKPPTGGVVGEAT